MKSLTDTYELKNQVKIPCIGFGTWQTPDGNVAENSVRTAIEAGYRHIDTAAGYENEGSVGRGIHSSGIPRGELFVTTKLWNSDHGYEETLRAFEVSMKKLQLDYCDLYLIHWPNPVGIRDCWEEKNARTWRAMEKLVSEGRIRAIGVSNFQRHHIEALLKTANIMPTVNQVYLNPSETQPELVSYCKKLGMLMEAYSPLGTGSLLKDAQLAAIAEKNGKSPAQVLLRWSLQKGFLPLPKSVSADRILANTELFDFELDAESMKAMDTLRGCVHELKDPDTVDF